MNDTVGCLCTGAYEDQEAQIGVIYGTGTNACYIEKLENIKTLNLNPNESDQVSTSGNSLEILCSFSRCYSNSVQCFLCCSCLTTGELDVYVTSGSESQPFID